MTATPTDTALDAVLAHIEAHRAAFVEDLLCYLRQPGISAQNVGIRETAVRSHVARHAPDVVVVELGAVPPSRTQVNQPFTGVVRQAIRLGQGVDPLICPVTGGTRQTRTWASRRSSPAVAPVLRCSHVSVRWQSRTDPTNGLAGGIYGICSRSPFSV